MAVQTFGLADHPAVVSRAAISARDPDRYLVLTGKGPVWTSDPAAATPFSSMREAMRAAVRLPGDIRAFGLPLESELTLRRAA